MSVLELFTFLSALLLIGSFFKYSVANNMVSISLFVLLAILIVIISVQNKVIWYYYPLYLILVLSLLLILFNFKHHVFIGVFLIVPLVFSAASFLAFPTFTMPVPTGSFLVGTRYYDVVDKTRIEQYDTSGKHREFRLQLWYPIDSNEGLERIKWLHEGLALSRALATDSNLPFFLLDKTASIESNSYLNGTTSEKEEKYPVVILSHGWRSSKSLYQDFAEELASHGYIVVGIDHSYASALTVFEDGHAKPIKLEIMGQGTAEFMKKAFVVINTFADDISCTIDFVTDLNSNSEQFLGKIDVDNIGLLGHSTGSGAEVTLATRDDRITSVIALDSWLEPVSEDVLTRGLCIPSLFLRCEQWEVGPNNKNLSVLINHCKNNPLVYQVQGTTHYDFSMAYMYSSLMKPLGYLGSTDSAYLTDMFRELITSFFDQTLKQGVTSDIELKTYDKLVDVSFD